MKEKFILFEKELKKMGLSLNDKQMDLFEKFYEDLMEKNRVMNLTTITTWEDVVIKHFIDSLSVIRIFNMNRPIKIIDLGTGAGFPGIPVKIAFPDTELVLVDATNKKVLFLNEEIARLGIQNITAVHARAEELGRNPEYREKFDCCLSRAVANLAALSEYCLPFVKPGGSFIAYKGGNSEEEVKGAEKAIRLLSGKIEKIENLVLGEDNQRTLIEIKKIKNISGRYPRRAGIPAREPLT